MAPPDQLRPPLPLLLALLALPVLALGGSKLTACVVVQRCTQDRDCVGGSCDEATGTCVEHECLEDADCGGFPFACEDEVCVVDCSDEPRSCPESMVPICGHFCIDTWEASRPDATEASVGTDDSMAVSQPGVLPWYSSSDLTQQVAATACEAAGKRLCTPQEWELVCATTEDLTYSYGDDYEPATCNGIDTYCDCDGDGEPDGDAVYPHCRQECSTDFHVEPTGSFPACTNVFGVYDINGNVWEVVSTEDGVNHFRGGAYNCSDSEKLHKCAYDGAENGGFPSAKGFRCCADGEPGE
jgi:sulfatase modifying factor 1